MPEVPFRPITETGAVVAELKGIAAKLENTNLILKNIAESLMRLAAQEPASPRS